MQGFWVWGGYFTVKIWLMFYMHLTLTGLLDLGVLFQTQVFSTFNGNVHETCKQTIGRLDCGGGFLSTVTCRY